MWSHGCGWRGPCGSGVGPWTDCIGRGSPCWRPVPLPASPSGGRGEMVLKDAFPVEGEAWSFCLQQDMLVLARPQSRLSLDRKRSLCPFPVPRGWGPGQGPGPTLRDCPRGLPAEAQGGARQPGHTLCLQEALLLAQRGDSLVLQESRVAGAAPLRGGGVSSGGGLFAPRGKLRPRMGQGLAQGPVATWQVQTLRPGSAHNLGLTRAHVHARTMKCPSQRALRAAWAPPHPGRR